MLRLLRDLLRHLVLIFKLGHYRNFDKINKRMLDFDQYKQVKKRELLAKVRHFASVLT